MTPGDGVLACTPAGGLTVCVEAETYQITPEDVRGLIFSGRPAPVVRSRVRHERGIITGEVTIEGYAALHPAGRAVVIRTREGAWVIPLVALSRVARGEAASAPLFAGVGL